MVYESVAKMVVEWEFLWVESKVSPKVDLMAGTKAETMADVKVDLKTKQITSNKKKPNMINITCRLGSWLNRRLH